uniref:NADH dehydrogenase [ubiquinone] 1 alpha subcomplex subunit 6 n=1 Tax=Fibrocapsa japonica TaxID=94617 RepID=A0A7S2XV13_9STRA|mmetsp:Transcript_1456/g.2010  ORF Transcript_1456/g.2010 Transcript_1456/m.2010 type:complete len:120 (+) Transcript_1456:107-466(+)|eukprot:CAMPEP_0113934708 /NCGR_PEP_ID=MMETSP1339-20121228/1985_1 /TAXON_ID=94617 /ORGANISM="Fibrocapsa japonica" /LENGTH=119 /DNA_ID=CAMNT_0000936615 /DNA_START=85 /DNA_END=444 /DNA_ORIENTATION=+ /assembly_acc=CAM_ASM_000762
MALRPVISTVSKMPTAQNPVLQLYRKILKELPRVMIIYDVDMPKEEANAAIAYHFRKSAHVKDERVIDLLVAKGYMHVEEATMQYKQKTHLMSILDPWELSEKFKEPETFEEKFYKGTL